MLDYDFAGKTVLVTGASRGIGAAIAVAFAESGADLVLAARDGAALEVVAAGLPDSAGSVLCVPTDVTDPAEVESLVAAAVGHRGRLDVAVNNAGGNPAGRRPLTDIAPSEFAEVVALNLNAVHAALHHEMPAMRAGGGGAIINMSSGSGLNATSGMGPYSAAKHGLIGLTKVAALEGAPDGVRVNALAPGPIMAGPLADMGEEFQRMAAESAPMGRVGQPSEVAEAVRWLCSERSAFVTGTTLPIDGGQNAGRA